RPAAGRASPRSSAAPRRRTAGCGPTMPAGTPACCHSPRRTSATRNGCCWRQPGRTAPGRSSIWAGRSDRRGCPPHGTGRGRSPPALRQIQVAVEQAVEVAAGEAEMDGDHAVLGLAQAAAPLLLDPGCLVSLLGITRLVDDPDSMRPGVLGGHDPEEPVTHQAFVPLELAEELLEGAWCYPCLQGDRFDALLGQIRELPPDVRAQVGTSVFATEAVIELVEESEQFRLQPANLLSIHALPSGSPWQDKSLASQNRTSNLKLAL